MSPRPVICKELLPLLKTQTLTTCQYTMLGARRPQSPAIIPACPGWVIGEKTDGKASLERRLLVERR